MLAAQGVAAHCAIMDSFRCATDPDTTPQLTIKFRANAVSMNRMFCTNLRELAHLQSRPLPPRPGPPPPPLGDGGDPPEAGPSASPGAKPKTSPAPPANPAVAASDSCPPPEPPVPLEDLPELPEDIATRPDGTPGNLKAYAPKVPVVPYIPREAPIMVALATRPKPWRMVNVPKDQEPPGTPTTHTAPPAAEVPEPERPPSRGPVDLRERIFTGDALARFAATRLDPNLPVEPMQFDSDASIVELELISTGGDPSAEGELAAMKAAHPEGKPIVTFRHGTPPPHGNRSER
jgi:hypothetical protein